MQPQVLLQQLWGSMGKEVMFKTQRRHRAGPLPPTLAWAKAVSELDMARQPSAKAARRGTCRDSAAQLHCCRASRVSGSASAHARVCISSSGATKGSDYPIEH